MKRLIAAVFFLKRFVKNLNHRFGAKRPKHIDVMSVIYGLFYSPDPVTQALTNY